MFIKHIVSVVLLLSVLTTETLFPQSYGLCEPYGQERKKLLGKKNSMAHFTILRFEKLKTRGSISGSSGHMMRSIPTLNADATRTVFNKILIGSDNPLADVDARLAGAATRKNSVLAIEVLISATPEWFADATKQEKTDWMRSSQAWLTEHFGSENLVHLQLHVDEATPHLTGFIVPRDTSGRLNAARWLDGSKKLSDMQTDYTKAVSHLGLERGLEGSKAEHVAPKRMRVKARDVDFSNPHTVMAMAERTAFAEQRLVEIQESAARMRNIVNAARDIPLPEVAEALGLSRDKVDKSAWVDAQHEHKVTLNGSQWFDHKAQAGGGGAIDLVVHVLKYGFKEAVSWLGYEVGQKATRRAVVAKSMASAKQDVDDAMRESLPFQPPVKDETAFWKVSRYLIGRGLSFGLIQKLRTEGRLYADDRANAVFLAVDASGRARGAELRGTSSSAFHGHAKGSSRALPWGFDTSENPKRLVFCESAIDAMSYAQLHGSTDCRVVSTGGAKPGCPVAVLPSIQSGRWVEVVIAYDNDKTGHAMAAKLQEELGGGTTPVTRSCPVHKDWNEDLVTPGDISFSQQNKERKPSG